MRAVQVMALKASLSLGQDQRAAVILQQPPLAHGGACPCAPVVLAGGGDGSRCIRSVASNFFPG